jgi:hypothetical protein
MQSTNASEYRVMMRKFNSILANLQKRMRTGRKMSSDDVCCQRIHTNMEISLTTHMDNRNSLDGRPRLSKIYITHSPPLFMDVNLRPHPLYSNAN